MKKLLIITCLTLGCIACDNNVETTNIQTFNKINYNDVETGRKYILEMISLTKYNTELSEIVNKYNIDDNTSIDTLLQLINELSQQDCFGDTLGETDSWLLFLEWYYSK